MADFFAQLDAIVKEKCKKFSEIYLKGKFSIFLTAFCDYKNSCHYFMLKFQTSPISILTVKDNFVTLIISNRADYGAVEM